MVEEMVIVIKLLESLKESKLQKVEQFIQSTSITIQNNYIWQNVEDNNIDVKELCKLYSAFKTKPHMSSTIDKKFDGQIIAYFETIVKDALEQDGKQVNLSADMLPYIIPLIRLEEAAQGTDSNTQKLELSVQNL